MMTEIDRKINEIFPMMFEGRFDCKTTSVIQRYATLNATLQVVKMLRYYIAPASAGITERSILCRIEKPDGNATQEHIKTAVEESLRWAKKQGVTGNSMMDAQLHTMIILLLEIINGAENGKGRT